MCIMERPHLPNFSTAFIVSKSSSDPQLDISPSQVGAQDGRVHVVTLKVFPEARSAVSRAESSRSGAGSTVTLPAGGTVTTLPPGSTSAALPSGSAAGAEGPLAGFTRSGNSSLDSGSPRQPLALRLAADKTSSTLFISNILTHRGSSFLEGVKAAATKNLQNSNARRLLPAGRPLRRAEEQRDQPAGCGQPADTCCSCDLAMVVARTQLHA